MIPKEQEKLLIKMWNLGATMTEISAEISKCFGINLSPESVKSRAALYQKKGLIKKRQQGWHLERKKNV